MANNEDYARLRRMTGETEADSTYTDVELDDILAQASMDFNAAAARIWSEKASGYADLVNISEGGSSRSNSDLFAHAKAQVDYFSSQSATPVVVGTPSTTRRIKRI